MPSDKRPLGGLRILSFGSSSKRARVSVPGAASSNTSNPNQPSNLHSASVLTNSSPPGILARRGEGTTGFAMLSMLKGSMKFLQKGCQAFSPLKSAIGTVLEVLESIEIVEQGSQELRGMASDLPQWAIVLSEYLSDSQPERMSKWVKKITEDLVEQAEYIRTQQQRGRLRRLADSEGDIEGLRKCYRCIEASFRHLQADAALSTWKIADDHLKDSRLNGLSPAHDARFDSSFSDEIKRGGCFHNTRVSVLEGIRDWMYGAGGVKIYWTNGMAGTGKTTIAYSVCVELKQHGRLGASFFCSRASPKCRDVSCILPTIAFQLAQQFYPFRSSLCRVLGEEPNVGQRNISMQFEHLIRIPLMEVKDMLPKGLVIVIDALDECSNPSTMEIILDALFRHAAQLPIRFFLTSRPEPSITHTILARDNESRSILHLHDVEKQFVKADIETYLAVMLAKLSLSGKQIKQLAEQAGILFIYAATVARYLLAVGRGANVSTRLATVLDEGTAKGKKKDQEIDQLYMAILGGVLGDKQLEVDEVELIKQVLWTVVCAREPVTKGTLAALLKVDEEQVSVALQPLRSVLHVSEGSDVVSTLHASLPDFMLSLERSGPSLCCNDTVQSKYLASRCFELMQEQLKFNICGLVTSYQTDDDVPGLKDRISTSISSELFYACRYWVEHLRHSPVCNELLACLDEFLRKELLFWMEVLNLKGWMGNGPRVLAEAQDWLPEGDEALDIRAFIHDARNFVTTFAANPVRQSTPHIYVSVLPLVSRQSKVWGNYWGRTRGLLRVDGTLMKQREGAELAMWEVGCAVTAINYSPDGARIVFGSSDQKIRVWDVHNGALLASPFEGHTGAITSAAFSSDGARIVSGSEDHTIRVWSMHSGAPLGSSLKGHSDTVTSVAFSPSGTYIISGSCDHTIRAWTVSDGAPLGGPFKGHTNAVTSVAFSHDSTRIVSGSWDRTIRVWNMLDGTPLGSPFKGHTDVVWSVAFSPDSASIVSSSGDHTIRVWSTHDCTLLGSPLEGHTGAVTSVVFSSSGTQIASGSIDCTVRVWDPYSGAQLGIFEAHTDVVWSVSFSPDGTRIVSGSWDHTIQVWSVPNETMLDDVFKGHTGVVWCVAFSPDGTHIASGSRDRTIRMWDVRSGTQIGGPFRGHTRTIWCVTFSPDGTSIASGSEDCTIRMWDVRSGTQLGSPFKGHRKMVTAIAFSPDGTRIVSSSEDRTIQVWDARSGAPLTSLFEGHASVAWSLAFSPNGTLIAAGSDDRTIRVWDMVSGTLKTSPFKGHTDAVWSIGFSPDGSRIVSSSEDCTVRMWDVDSGTQLGKPLKGHTKAVWSVSFSPDGNRIASSSTDCTIRVWDVHRGTQLGSPFEGHTGVAWCVAFSPDGTRIASGSEDRTIRIWDVEGLEAPRPQTSIPRAGRCHLDDQGWVVDSTSRALLFWYPAKLRDIFPMPQNTLTISSNGSIKPDFSNLLLGETWSQCYQSL